MCIKKKFLIMFLGMFLLFPQVSHAQVPSATSTEEVVCCSNVLFLPGIQASRLSAGSDHLWEPLGDNDVKKLYLDRNNITPSNAIQATEIISSAYMVVPVYKKFIAMMDDMVSEGVINDWFPFAYDWRNAVMDFPEPGGNLIKKVESLAETSKTKKIIIIAHSNGGLIAKELMRQLEKVGKGKLVEKVLMVAVPELGTPQAVFAMLHGDGQEIGWGRLLSKNTARTFSQIMPGAFGLLPGRNFFSKSEKPVLIDNGRPIDTHESMKTFLSQNSWSRASSTDVDVPLLLKNSLLSVAEFFHVIIDPLKPSSATKIVSIAGWGIDTPETLAYTRTPHCSTTSSCEIDRDLQSSFRGDGTVLALSHALLQKDSQLFFNMKEFIKDTWHVISHGNIFEAEPLLEVVKEEVLIGTATSSHERKYFSVNEPVYRGTDMMLTFYSPVDIDIYTPEGRHTGIIPSPVPGMEFPWLENEIGAMTYGFGPENTTKQVGLPYGPEYQFVVRGNDAGALIVKIELEKDDEYQIASTTFLEIPITPLTQIDLVVATSSETLTKGSYMYIDADGDGVTDFIQRTAEALSASPYDVVADFALYVEAMRKTILALKLPETEEKSWIQKLDKILAKVEKKHPHKAEKMVKKLGDKRFPERKLTKEQKRVILTVFEKLALRLETENFTNIDH